MAYPYQKKIDREELIKIIKNHKSVCWYPSAGSDFRPLLYLTKAYCDQHEELSADKDVFPDLFVFTDYCSNAFYSYDYSNYIVDPFRRTVHTPPTPRNSFGKIAAGNLMRGDILYADINTTFTVKSASNVFIKDLEECENACSADKPRWFGAGCYMTLEVNSHRGAKLGRWYIDVIYLYAENAAFAKHILIKNRINTDFICRINYGFNANGDGNWIFYAADALSTKYFLSDMAPYEYNYTDSIMEYLKDGTDIDLKLPAYSLLYERLWYDGRGMGWLRVER